MRCDIHFQRDRHKFIDGPFCITGHQLHIAYNVRRQSQGDLSGLGIRRGAFFLLHDLDHKGQRPGVKGEGRDAYGKLGFSGWARGLQGEGHSIRMC